MPPQPDAGGWLLVDASYVIFYRLYALASWYRRAHPTGPDLGMKAGAGEAQVEGCACTPGSMTLQEGRALFREKLLGRLRRVLAELMDAPAADRVLFCLDGERNWRKAYDSMYKKNRRQSSFVRELFGACVQEMRAFAQRREASSAILHHPELEADDVIHFIVSHLWTTRPEGAPPPRFVIVANDHDYVPLLHLVPPPALRIVDMRWREVRGLRGVPVEDYLLVKILAGDKSDNIPPVFARCGVKTALRLAQNPSELHHKLCQYPGARDRLERNRTLVDNAYALHARPQLRAWLTEQALAQERARRRHARSSEGGELAPAHADRPAPALSEVSDQV